MKPFSVAGYLQKIQQVSHTGVRGFPFYECQHTVFSFLCNEPRRPFFDRYRPTLTRAGDVLAVLGTSRSFRCGAFQGFITFTVRSIGAIPAGPFFDRLVTGTLARRAIFHPVDFSKIAMEPRVQRRSRLKTAKMSVLLTTIGSRGSGACPQKLFAWRVTKAPD